MTKHASLQSLKISPLLSPPLVYSLSPISISRYMATATHPRHSPAALRTGEDSGGADSGIFAPDGKSETPNASMWADSLISIPSESALLAPQGISSRSPSPALGTDHSTGRAQATAPVQEPGVTSPVLNLVATRASRSNTPSGVLDSPTSSPSTFASHGKDYIDANSPRQVSGKEEDGTMAQSSSILVMPTIDLEHQAAERSNIGTSIHSSALSSDERSLTSEHNIRIMLAGGDASVRADIAFALKSSARENGPSYTIIDEPTLEMMPWSFKRLNGLLRDDISYDLIPLLTNFLERFTDYCSVADICVALEPSMVPLLQQYLNVLSISESNTPIWDDIASRYQLQLPSLFPIRSSEQVSTADAEGITTSADNTSMNTPAAATPSSLAMSKWRTEHGIGNLNFDMSSKFSSRESSETGISGIMDATAAQSLGLYANHAAFSSDQRSAGGENVANKVEQILGNILAQDDSLNLLQRGIVDRFMIWRESQNASSSSSGKVGVSGDPNERSNSFHFPNFGEDTSVRLGDLGDVTDPLYLPNLVRIGVKIGVLVLRRLKGCLVNAISGRDCKSSSDMEKGSATVDVSAKSCYQIATSFRGLLSLTLGLSLGVLAGYSIS